MRSYFLAMTLLAANAAYATQISSISFLSSPFDTHDTKRVAQGIFKSLPGKAVPVTKAKQTKTTKTFRNITCTEVKDAELGDKFAYYDCTIDSRTWSPAGVITPSIRIESDPDPLIEIAADPSYFKDLNLSKVDGVSCKIDKKPGLAPGAEYETQTCQLELR